MTDETDLTTFTTKAGTTLTLRRVAPRHIARIVAAHPIPEAPTYEFVAAGGVVIKHSHDATTLETPEDHMAWANYAKAKSDAVKGLNTAILHFLIYQCVVDEPPPPDKWSVDWGLFGLTPPDPADKVAYKVDWLESEIAVDLDDYAALIARLYRLGGIIKEDQARDFEAFFRATLERLATAQM